MNEADTFIELSPRRESAFHPLSRGERAGVGGRSFVRSLWLIPASIFAALAGAVAEDAPSSSASDLASKLSARMQDGASVVRLKMEVRGAARSTVQLQAKARRTEAGTDVLYQVLWPKERKGEGFLLHQPANGEAGGHAFSPPGSLTPLGPGKMSEAALGSALSYQDFIENFFAWPSQSLVGTGTVERVPCAILESKPGKGGRSIYSMVRSWIDTKRLVTMRVEKYAGSGQLLRRIQTTRVAEDDQDRRVPATLVAQCAGRDGETEIEGTNIRHDVTLADADFTPEALRAMAASGAAKNR